MKEKSSFNCSFSFPLICLHFNNNRLIIRTGLLNSPWHTPAWSFSPGQRWCGLPETHHGKSHWPKTKQKSLYQSENYTFPTQIPFFKVSASLLPFYTPYRINYGLLLTSHEWKRERNKPFFTKHSVSNYNHKSVQALFCGFMGESENTAREVFLHNVLWSKSKCASKH